jgi:hypothetical protein
MSADPGDSDFESRFARVEQLLAELSECTDPRLERVAREILSTVLELHQRGLARLLAASDERVRRDLARDPHVSAMLLLHGLHPLSLDTRVTQAIDDLRGRLESKLQDVGVHVHEGRITVRVVPVTGTCGSTRAALQKEFAEVLLAVAPDAESVSVESSEPAPALVTLRLRRPGSGERADEAPR